MPYIRPERRWIAPKVESRFDGPGELNFALTSVCLEYAAQFEPANYQVFNDIIGALEAAKLEFYRRMVVPYEQHKAELNGDVYPQDLGPGR